ncbi:MAG: hypothetical protein ACI9OJ_002263 [Myxococcota bacterium]
MIRALVLLCATSLASCVGGSDSESSDEDAQEAATECAPGCGSDEAFATLGQNALQTIDETGWRNFIEVDGQLEAHVIRGSGNGFWMVVLAVQTNQFGCCVDRVDLDASATRLDGVPVAELRRKRVPVIAAADGDRYVVNIFLIFPGPEDGWKDQDVFLRVALTPETGGASVAINQRVTLRKM